jgi:hypothetical protein
MFDEKASRSKSPHTSTEPTSVSNPMQMSALGAETEVAQAADDFLK